MEVEFKGRSLSLTKELTIYDRLALAFSAILQKHDVEHVFVSGYVAILFGRSRTSEDVDLLAKKQPFADFSALWDDLSKDFYCHNANDAKGAYHDYLEEDLAVRFSMKDHIIPNVEFKWASTGQQKRVLAGFLTVSLPEGNIPISRLEPQIAYKLYLGSDKDIEDARYLFELFRERLDLRMLTKDVVDLGLSVDKAMEQLGW